MKYTSSNQPIRCIMTNSTCYKGTVKFVPQGVLWHSTGANNPNIRRYVQPSENDANYTKLMALIGTNTNKNDWNHIYRKAGVNAFIGKLADGTIASVQTLEWNQKPWGCGSGSKGSCNATHLQFEICEDSLSNATYFNQVYKEACELTAYWCKMFNIDPHGTIMRNGVAVPTILCHADSYKLGFGSNHGDVLHWFRKYGKTMDDVRNDVAAIMGMQNATVYRVRKSWVDSKSQIGAYSNLTNAKVACVKAGVGYHVFDASGNIVYSVATTSSDTFKAGDEVKLVTGAKYTSGNDIPSWVFNRKLYVRQVRPNGDIIISTLKTGAITGTVAAKYLTAYNAPAAFSPYKVQVTVDALNIRAGAGTKYKVKGVIRDKGVYTIIAENGGWGYLKSRVGWIDLDYTKKI